MENLEPITQEQCLNLIDDFLQGRADGKRHLAKELATLLDVNPVTISRWKKGKNMSTKTMRAIEFFCRKQATSESDVTETKNSSLPIMEDQDITRKILDAIMSSDMCDACKIKAYNIIKSHK